jgi:F0F1-type ATP synthase assembly protein I
MAEKKKKHWARALADATNMVTTFAAAVAICGYAGYWLDQKLNHQDYWMTVIGILLGLATGIKTLWDKMQESKPTITENTDNTKSD